MTATIGMNLTERGAYDALMDQYYAREAPLPKERKEVYRLAAAASASERKAVDYVLSRFFTEEADGWHQKRCDEEISKYREKAAKAAESASARWGNRNANVMRTHTERNANASETHDERNANQEPIANNQEKEKTKAPRFALPAWVPSDVWQAFEEHRQRLRKPMTDRARTLMLRELEKLRPADPGAILEQSIRKGWQDVFPLKEAPPAQIRVDA